MLGMRLFTYNDKIIQTQAGGRGEGRGKKEGKKEGEGRGEKEGGGKWRGGGRKWERRGEGGPCLSLRIF